MQYYCHLLVNIISAAKKRNTVNEAYKCCLFIGETGIHTVMTWELKQLTLMVVWLWLHADIRCGFDPLSHRDISLLERNDSPLYLHQQVKKLYGHTFFLIFLNCIALKKKSTEAYAWISYKLEMRSTFFFNQFIVFSWLYRLNFSFPTSGRMKQSI